MKKRITAVLLIAFGALGFLAWATYLEIYEIDISSGERRVSTRVLFVTIYSEIRTTGVSELLAGDVSEPDWRREHSFAGGSRISPNYTFHGASSEFLQLEYLWKGYRMNESERRASASHLLAIWQLTESRFSGSDYVSSLYRFFDRATETERSEFSALVMPAVREEDGIYSKTVFFADGTPLGYYEGYISSVNGRFVKDGVWRMWNINGKLEVYGHFKDGKHHGRRFEWNRDGRLSSIVAYNQGRLVEFESRDLSQHAEYDRAQQVAGGNE
jgi:hypothetical protein